MNGRRDVLVCPSGGKRGWGHGAETGGKLRHGVWGPVRGERFLYALLVTIPTPIPGHPCPPGHPFWPHPCRGAIDLHNQPGGPQNVPVPGGPGVSPELRPFVSRCRGYTGVAGPGIPVWCPCSKIAGILVPGTLGVGGSSGVGARGSPCRCRGMSVPGGLWGVSRPGVLVLRGSCTRACRSRGSRGAARAVHVRDSWCRGSQ